MASQLQDRHLYFTKVGSIPDCFNEDCYSLSDILRHVRPETSLHFNFMVHVGWVLEQYPAACKQTPITFVVGDSSGTPSGQLRREIAALSAQNIQVHGAVLPIPFGTHHTKMSIFEADSVLHVLVYTANFIEGDWAEKTQMFYYCTAKMDTSSSQSEEASSFQLDLLAYLKCYPLMPCLQYWIERVAGADFKGNADRLIYSFPGYHKGEQMRKVGHLSLRDALCDAEPDDSSLYVAQCSSIGSLGKDPEQFVLKEFITSLRGGRQHGSRRLYLVYPTVEDVRASLEGYRAGASLPYAATTHLRQRWLRQMLCKWRADAAGRTGAMPHVKTYCEFGADRQPKWLLLTSANLSKAAWGALQKKGAQLAVRSYEAGVLVKDAARFKLPFDYPLAKYRPADEPWLVDRSYEQRDSLGGTWRPS